MLEISVMKKTLLFAIALIFFASCKSDNRQITADMIHFPDEEGQAGDEVPVIVFDSLTANFGTIAIGETFLHTFRFRNEGKAPLIIAQVNPSCGCTVPKDWPHDPVAPGESGEITVEFNSKGSPGKIDKSISVLTNCVPKVVDLKISGMVSGVETQTESTKPIEMEFETR
jgi:hypothetical protein